MTDERQEKDKTPSGSGGAPGQPIQPSPYREPPRREGEEVQEVPIGMPVSPERLRQLKEQAEKPSSQEDEATVDEENSATKE
jgi:hypothetical protein